MTASASSLPVRYEELRPLEWRAVMDEAPVVYWPLGVIEWHGEHLPLGLDSLKTHELCLRVAERFGGIVYPPSYFGYEHVTPFDPKYRLDGNVSVDEVLFRGLARRTFRQFAKAGFKVAIAITGHYPLEQIVFLKEEADAVTRSSDDGIVIWAFADFEPVTDLGYTGDHAAKWETSLMWHLRPELVDIERLPENYSEAWGLWGEDPRVHASPDLGREVADEIVERIGQRARELLTEARSGG
jgi:creatinine amidohydrolase